MCEFSAQENNLLFVFFVKPINFRILLKKNFQVVAKQRNYQKDNCLDSGFVIIGTFTCIISASSANFRM